MFVVSLYDFLNDGKPQACSLFVLSAGKVGFVETLPDLVLIFAGDSDPLIFY